MEQSFLATERISVGKDILLFSKAACILNGDSWKKKGGGL